MMMLRTVGMLALIVGAECAADACPLARADGKSGVNWCKWADMTQAGRACTHWHILHQAASKTGQCFQLAETSAL